MYSEKSKVPWSAIVVGGAVLVFGCIVAGSLLARGLLPGALADGPPADGATAVAPSGSVAIDISSASTKEDWMNAMVEQFNQGQVKLPTGEVIFARVAHVTSGGSQQAILDGRSQPVVWSPGDQSWVDGINQTWRDRTGQPLVNAACAPTVLAPIGFAMWRPMAEALGWPDAAISWDDLVALSEAPDGWASLGHAEWGLFKFGHTHPDFSNAGLLMMTALAYSTVGQTSGITAEQVYGDAVLEAFAGLEQNTYHYGLQSRPLLRLAAERGPDYLHAVTTSEAETLKINAEFGEQMRFQFVFIFPAEGTYWSEQPYCILGGDWVTDEQRAAAEIFRDYLLDTAQQAKAIDYYLRPIDTRLPLHAPLALESGTDPRVTPSTVPGLESPSAEVAAAVQDVFHQTKKKATIVLVLDSSGSMEGDKIKEAVASSVNFIQRLDPDDEIYVLGFGGEGDVYPLGGGRAGDEAENLAQALNGVFASGNTPLYDAVCAAAERIDELQAADQADGERRLYGIVLLSDGDDTASTRTENQMFSCLPSGESVEGVKVFTIAYGEDAKSDLMLRIANRTNGKTFKGDPDSIESIYNAIAAEQ